MDRNTLCFYAADDGKRKHENGGIPKCYVIRMFVCVCIHAHLLILHRINLSQANKNSTEEISTEKNSHHHNHHYQTQCINYLRSTRKITDLLFTAVLNNFLNSEKKNLVIYSMLCAVLTAMFITHTF